MKIICLFDMHDANIGAELSRSGITFIDCRYVECDRSNDIPVILVK